MSPPARLTGYRRRLAHVHPPFGMTSLTPRSLMLRINSLTSFLTQLRHGQSQELLCRVFDGEGYRPFVTRIFYRPVLYTPGYTTCQPTNSRCAIVLRSSGAKRAVEVYGVEMTKWDVDRGLRDTMKDPTRALIFNEVLTAEEVSGSTLAARLGVPAQNLYYHLHRLAEWGIVETAREEVVRGCWVEKYYRLSDALTRVLSYQLSPIDEALQSASAEEKKATIVSLLNIASAVIARAAERYASMDADEFARLLDEERLVMVTFGALERGQFMRTLKVARDHRRQVEWRPPSAGGPGATVGDQVVIACLPGVVGETQARERPVRSTKGAAAPANRP